MTLATIRAIATVEAKRLIRARMAVMLLLIMLCSYCIYALIRWEPR